MSEKPQSSDDESPSTGFLPMTLALTLFIVGLFTLGLVPGVSCGKEQATPAAAPEAPQSP
ncbi:MAG: hypothetical protein KC420_08805 [Myxococcales bacterium]|nr:hypothetical protein [Myxococcales bacterium]MCB9567269.1 hypothetical protein [Myxococcales bacterium]MCB9704320.1 hypothetical protein [Myxococcales bacterium]